MCYLQISIYYLFSLFEVLYLIISAFYGGRFIILFAFVLVLVFTKFPVGPDEDEAKCWHTVKTKINAKC